MKDDYRNIFAKRLQYYMGLNNLSQAELCARLGFTKSAVSTWVLGTRIPRPEVVDKLADFFEIKRSDLLEIKKVGSDDSVSIEGQKILKAYNENPKVKILYDKVLNLSDKDLDFLIGMTERMNNN